MDAKEREEAGNTETEEETVAREKKRSRRVSFAEITSVHVFDRDEEYETPPDSKPSSENPEPGEANEALGFQRDFGDSDDSKELSHYEEDEEDDDEDERVLFVRGVDSSSPGSAVGSVTSNDEENFFGPVSPSFIRSGRLSDSAASDDNHDITLDSTAFSMHFRSLMQSDSGGNFKTPTGVHLAFEEKTPTENSMPTNTGSFMVLTGVKKPLTCSSVSDGKSSSYRDSNEMSLIEENPDRYDYGRLSPTLDALLAEGSKGLHASSISDHITISKSPNYLNRDGGFPKLDGHKSDLVDLEDSSRKEVGNIVIEDTPAEVISGAIIKLYETNGESATTPIGKVSYDCSSSTKHALPADASIGQQNQTLCESTQGMPFDMDKVAGEDALEVSGCKLEFGAYNSVTFTPPNKMLHADLVTQHDCGYIGGAEGSRREESLEGGGYTPNTLQNPEHHCGSPLAGSISSLRAKRRQIILDTTVSSRSEKIATPARKSKILETATQEVGADSLKQAFLHHSFKPPSYATAGSENSEDSKLKHVDVSLTDLEGHLLSAVQKDKEQKSTTKMDTHGVETPKHIRIVRQAEESSTIVQDGECGEQISTGLLCKDQSNNARAVGASPFQLSGSGKQMQQHSLASHNPIGGTFVASEPDFSLRESALDKQFSVTPDKVIYSPLKMLEKEFSASPEHTGILSRALKQQDQGNNFVSLGQGHDTADSGAIVAKLSHSTPIAGKLGSLFKEKISESSSSINANNSVDSINLIKWKGIGNNKFLYHVSQKETGNTTDYHTPMQHRANLNSQSGSLDRNFQTGTGLAKFKEKLSERESKASLHESASPYGHQRTTMIPLGKVAQSPSMKEAYNIPDSDNMQPFVGKDPLSPKSIQYSNGNSHSDHHVGHCTLQKPSTVCDVENSGRKRRSEEIILMEKGHANETGRIQKSPKVLETGGSFSDLPSKDFIERNNEVDKTGVDTILKHWSDVFSKFSGAMKQLLSPSTDKLNLRELDILEDILAQLQKAKKYEKLCTEIQIQKIHDHLGNLQQKRVAEARWLQHMLVYEHAKLQLMHVKRDLLLKRVQRLQSGIRESQIMKFNSLQHLCVPGVREVDNKESHIPSLSVNHKRKNKEASNRVTIMRQALGALDQKIKNLTRSFHAACNIKGELSSDETIVFVNDDLKKKTCCRFIRQDLQLWNVDDLESKNGHYNVVLNYHNFLLQRFLIKAGPASSIVTSNRLNDEDIKKAFPNINACTAFWFVFNAGAIQKHSNPKCLAQETQITSSLLGNLLDVVEEVQVAHIELPNLIQTSFHSPCAEQLNLQLCFIDFKTGRKVTLTLDMTILNHGMYPFDIIPSQLQTHLYEVQTPAPPLSLSAEIQTAVGSLKGGHARIIRLCRCVSQLVQALSR